MRVMAVKPVEQCSRRHRDRARKRDAITCWQVTMAIEIAFSRLDYPRRWENRALPDGRMLRVFAAYGMPRLDDNILRCVFYLYPDKAHAAKGSEFGGTGFLVGVKSSIEGEPVPHLYAVSNAHVVCEGSCASVIRFNTEQGGHLVHELDPSDWESHPDGDDIAISPVPYLEFGEQVHAAYVEQEIFLLGTADAAMPNVGIGDDTFMIGKYVHHAGISQNHPSVRFGNISIMPNPNERIYVAGRKFYQESYCVDMRSVEGYSGSPVFVYRSRPSGMIARPQQMIWKLLGIHWGAVKEKATPKSKKGTIHTGINYVVPSWKLQELLMIKKFVDQRKKDDEALEKKQAAAIGNAVLDSSMPMPKSKHEKDFDRLLKRAVRRQK